MSHGKAKSAQRRKACGTCYHMQCAMPGRHKEDVPNRVPHRHMLWVYRHHTRGPCLGTGHTVPTVPATKTAKAGVARQGNTTGRLETLPQGQGKGNHGVGWAGMEAEAGVCGAPPSTLPNVWSCIFFSSIEPFQKLTHGGREVASVMPATFLHTACPRCRQAGR